MKSLEIKEDIVTYYIPYVSIKQLCILAEDCFNFFQIQKYKHVNVYIGDKKPIISKLLYSKGLKNISYIQINNLINLIKNKEINFFQVDVDLGQDIIKLVNDYSYILAKENQRKAHSCPWARDFSVIEKLEILLSSNYDKVNYQELMKIYDILVGLEPYYALITINDLINNASMFSNQVCYIEAYPRYKERESYDMYIDFKNVAYITFDNYEKFEKKANIMSSKVLKLEHKYSSYYNISSMYVFKESKYRVIDFLECNIIDLDINSLFNKRVFVIIAYDQIVANEKIVKKLKKGNKISIISGEKAKIHGFRSK